MKKVIPNRVFKIYYHNYDTPNKPLYKYILATNKAEAELKFRVELKYKDLVDKFKIDSIKED